MNFIKRFHVSKNEDCPCGSGKSYKQCCYSRPDKEIDTAHLQKLMLDIARGFDTYKFEVCLHPNQGECKPPIKQAHSIQNHGILSQISEKNHVMAYRTDKMEKIEAKQVSPKEIHIQFRMSRVGVNNATTQTCFCNFHDSKVFSPIECNPNGFQANDLEQLFIYAYKAFAFEYYKSKVAMVAIQNLYETIPKKLKKYPWLLTPYLREAQLKEIEMEYYKAFFDKGLMNNDYSSLITKVIPIPYKINFATTECISPSYKIDGHKIPKMVDGQMRRIFITVFPDNVQSFILISYLEADKLCFEQYVDQLLSLEQSDLLNYFSVILPLYSENLVLSPRLWNSWGKEGQEVLTGLLNILGAKVIMSEAGVCKRMNLMQKNKIPFPPCSADLFKKI